MAANFQDNPGGHGYSNPLDAEGQKIQHFVLTDPGAQQILHEGERTDADGTVHQTLMSDTYLRDRKQKLLQYLQSKGMWGDGLTLGEDGNVFNRTDTMTTLEKALLIGSTAAATGGIAASFAAPAIAGEAGAHLGATASGTLPSTAFSSAAPIGLAAGAPAASLAAGTTTLPAVAGGIGGVGGGVGGGGTLGTLSNILRAGGQAVGSATQAAGQNRVNQVDQNIRGQSAFEQQLLNRADLEAKQRATATTDMGRADFFQNFKGSPYDPRPPVTGADYLKGLTALQQQALQTLSQPAQYQSSTLPAVKPYVPSQPSTGETVGTYASPILSTLGTLLSNRNGDNNTAQTLSWLAQMMGRG